MWIPQSLCVPLDLCYKVGSSPKGRQVWGSSPQEAVSPHCCLHVVITGAMARLADTSRTSYNGRCNEIGQHNKVGDILDPNSVTLIAKLKNTLLNQVRCALLSCLYLKVIKTALLLRGGRKVTPRFVYMVYRKCITFTGKLCLDLGPIPKLSHTCK